MKTFDPEWLRSGEFSVGGDTRPRRTEQVCRELCVLEKGRRLLMHPIREQGRPPMGYYLREGEEGAVEAQYYLYANAGLRALTLGLSVEKGETGRRASADRRMRGAEWDWPRLIALAGTRLAGHVRRLSDRLERPISVVIDYHLLDDEGVEQKRHMGVHTWMRGEWWARGARSSSKLLADQLRHVNDKPDWWSDVWIVADFEAQEAKKMTPLDVAQALFQFKPLRDVLRGRRA